MAKQKYSRLVSLSICIMVYVVAWMGAWLTVSFFKTEMNMLLLTLVADVVATLVVFVFSVVFKNASLYDPYWSVAPPVIALYWLKLPVGEGMSVLLPSVLMLTAITIWAVRLTFNWVRGWPGLGHEDWRYRMLHDKNPSMYWLTNLGGIHLFPTLMVFAGMLPVYFTGLAHGNISTGVLFIGFFISVGAAMIELVADEQLRAFKKRAAPGSFIDEGIWRYSRHPNYFGEISFWFGLWVMQMAVAPQCWYTGIGFVAMIGLFVFASIPMMEEKNKKNKPGYEKYMASVSRLIPWFRRG